MRLNVNGAQREFPDGTTLSGVLGELGAPTTGVAVAVDGTVVPRVNWTSETPTDGATVEILTAVQGG